MHFGSVGFEMEQCLALYEEAVSENGIGFMCLFHCITLCQNSFITIPLNFCSTLEDFTYFIVWPLTCHGIITDLHTLIFLSNFAHSYTVPSNVIGGDQEKKALE